MKLFLASELKHPDTFNALDTFVGGITGKKIAYIPTAANGEGWGSWRDGGSWQLVQSLDAQVTVVELEKHDTAEVAKICTEKEILWFGGGYCGYLMYWMRRRELDTLIPLLLKKGIIYAGSSAGSMVTADTLDIAEWYVRDQEKGAGYIPGLGLVDFDIFPHFAEEELEEIKAHYTGKKLYLLKNGEEVIVEDGQVSVIGEERIITSSMR